MTDDERRKDFARAFITQARSDWNIYQLLAAQDGVATCHRLHYLQMTCEKLAKAYRLRDTETSVDEIISKHRGFEKFVGAFYLTVMKARSSKQNSKRHVPSHARSKNWLQRPIVELLPKTPSTRGSTVTR